MGKTNNRHTHEDYLIKLQDKGITKIIPIEEYQHSLQPIKHKCLDCGHMWDIAPAKVLHTKVQKRRGCPICSNRILVVGKNDLWTTHKEYAELLLNADDGYRYHSGSTEKVDWKCKCGHIIKNRIIERTIRTHSLACPFCSDGVSYPNRLVREVFRFLNINFESEKKFSWSNGKIYDIYISDLNGISIIIENDGEQHKNTGFEHMSSGKSLEKQIANDKWKEETAINNGIDLFFRIDCSKSELDYIKQSILDSDISKYINFESVDWEQCHKKTLTSKVIEACNLWNQGHKDKHEVAKMIMVSPASVRRYWGKGVKAGICDYDPVKAEKDSWELTQQKLKRKCICIEDQKTFNSISEAASYYNISTSAISDCCNGIAKYTEYSNVANRKLQFVGDAEEDTIVKDSVKKDYYNWITNKTDNQTFSIIYLWNQEKLVKEIIEQVNVSKSVINRSVKYGKWVGLCEYDPKKSQKRSAQTMVRCITTGEVFDSIREATKQYNIYNESYISCCCRGVKNNTVNMVSGERYQWEYYKEEAMDDAS